MKKLCRKAEKKRASLRFVELKRHSTDSPSFRSEGLNPRSVKSVPCRQRLATVATFLRSCVARALSGGDGPRHSLHASAKYREYNEEFGWTQADFFCPNPTRTVRTRQKNKKPNFGPR